jgi:hypothetical protein
MISLHVAAEGPCVLADTLALQQVNQWLFLIAAFVSHALLG